MASIVDVDNAPGDLNELENSLREAVTQNDKKEDDTNKDADTNIDDVNVQNDVSNDPLKGTKFEGKTAEDLLESYNNLQSAYGRMANDLGTQRKLTDRLLDLKRDEDLASNAPQPYKVDAARLLDDPTQALDEVLTANNARVTSGIEEKLANLEAQLQSDRFMQKHPDFMTIGNSAEFQEWAQSTPVRNRVAQAAAGGDWEAADALLEEWKVNKPAEKAPTQDNTAELEEARKASLESANQGSPSDAKQGKVYRRADLIDLKINKPHVYGDPTFQQEILKAYAEGRVK